MAMIALVPPPTTAAEPYPVAGLTPWQRPAGAPRIDMAMPTDMRAATQGIAAPALSGLAFLDHQGGWYTPFSRPGMTEPYDLRGWHAAAPSSRQDKQ